MQTDGGRKWLQISKFCAVSIRKLISVAELLAEHNADIQIPMSQCCDQLHRMVTIIEDQCEQLDLPDRTPTLSKLFYSCLKNTLNLLSRLLQLVDIDLLKPLLSTNHPTVHFKRLTDVTNFTELTKAYTQLALEFMQLIQAVSNKTNKNTDQEKQDERRRARLIEQQKLSQRCVILLLTCCKTCVRYPQCSFASNNRTMLLMQMRKSLDHIQEILLRQFSSNIISVCTVPTSTNSSTTNLPIASSFVDNFLLQNEPNQLNPQLNPVAVYRSIPIEQRQFYCNYLPYYLPYLNEKYLKQRSQFPFLSSNFFDCNNNFNLSNRLTRFYNNNNNNQTRAGTLITNENCKLININNFHWLDNFELGNCGNISTQNGASDDFLPYSQPINNLDVYLNKFRSDNNFINSNKYPSNTKLHLPNLPLSSLSFKENEKLFKQTKSSPTHLLSNDGKLKEKNFMNSSRTTNYTSTNASDIRDIRNIRDDRQQFSYSEPYSNFLASDGLGSRSTVGSHCSSSCLPIYNSDLNSLNSFDLLPYPNGHNLHHHHQQHQNQLMQQNLIRQNIEQNVQHHYLLSQIQNLQQQQHQFYDNVFTNVFYNNSDSSASDYKTDQCLTIHNLLGCFEELISLSRLTCHSQAFREKISQCLELGGELSQEFTDSPYTSHSHREKIISLNERVLFELEKLLEIGSQMEKIPIPADKSLENVTNQILSVCTELKQQLQQATLKQAHLLFKHSNPYDLLSRLRNSILFNDYSKYTFEIDLFIEHYEYLRDTVKQLHHIAPSQSQQIRTKHAHFCLSIFGPMLLNSIQTLINNFNPKIDSQMSLTNYQVFFDFWIQLYIDIYDLFCSIVAQTGLRPSENSYQSFTTNQPKSSNAIKTSTLNSSTLNSIPQQTLIHPNTVANKPSVQPSMSTGLSVPLSLPESLNNKKYQHIPEIIEPTTETTTVPTNQQQQQDYQPNDKQTPSNYCANCCKCEQSRACCNRQGQNTSQMEELARKRNLEENEIVEKCKLMTQFVNAMLEFKNGVSEQLKTTQDLFTQAETFGEEANKFYKVVRYLTYQVPSGQLKKDLLDSLDKIPTFIQELMFAVRYNTAIGLDAAVNKMDIVLNQANQLLAFVQNTSHISIQCAKRYNLDLETIQSGRISPMFEDTGMRSRTDTRRKQAQSGSSDSRRTRVSFLLF